MSNLSPDAWRDIVDAAPEGIVVCDATLEGHPVVYANVAVDKDKVDGYITSCH